MKLYIKANSLKILKNLDDLLPSSLAKTATLLQTQSDPAYMDNIRAAKVLQSQKKELFFEDKAFAQLVKGVYFGNTHCEHLLPSAVELMEAKNICTQKHYNFVLALPALSQSGFTKLETLLNILDDGKTYEVVANDFGVLQVLLQRDYLKPILGLHFTKVIKNAFADSVTPQELSPTQWEKQKKLLRHCEFELAETRAFYKAMGISRISLENIAIESSFLDDSPKMYCDLYYPHSVLSNSKACDIAGLFDDPARYFVQAECARYCHSVSLSFADSKTLGLQQRYNSIYNTHTALELSKTVMKGVKNRLVWELFV